MKRFSKAFFRQDPLTCAAGLIGCHLEWQGCVARIVETEAYDAEDDPACHTWFRPTAREFVRMHEAGTAYVYLNYGMHWLFNILVKGGERSGFVLLRAVEPVAGVEAMRDRRPGVRDRLLGAGPGRLTRALGIDGSAHGLAFLTTPGTGLRNGHVDRIVTGPRIGISRAAEFPWRFGDPASGSLSRPF